MVNKSSFENELRDRFREYLKNLRRAKNKRVIYNLFIVVDFN